MLRKTLTRLRNTFKLEDKPYLTPDLLTNNKFSLNAAYELAVEHKLFNLEWYEAHCGKFAVRLCSREAGSRSHEFSSLE